MTKEAISTERALKLALEALEANRRTHYYCEDIWYSCPKHEDGCANESEGDECNCGADEINAQLDKAITALRVALASQGEALNASLAQQALDRMAENARELGLDYGAKSAHRMAAAPSQTDWEAVAADQAMTIALLKAVQQAPVPREPVALPEKTYEFVLTPEPVKWHHPECEGQCIACLIEQVVQETYGSLGLGYLQRHLTSPPTLSLAQPGREVLEAAHTRLQKKYGELEGKVRRTWVGLTDEEVSKMPAWIYSPDQDGMTAEEGLEVFARAIEANLKEKNSD